MRILHVGNPANAAWRLAQGQIALGHEAKVLTIGEQPYGFPSDIHIPAPMPGVRTLSGILRWQLMVGFDVIHVHGGIYPLDWIYPLFKSVWRSKTLAIHFHGSEVRNGRGINYLRSGDRIFVATPDLRSSHALRYIEARWIPNPIDLASDLAWHSFHAKPPDQRPVFGHFPSSGSMKGTLEIARRFHEAFPDGEAEFRIHEGVPYSDMPKAMALCDAVIDQHRPEIGAYGYISIEAMALGKPVFCTLNPGLYRVDCPILPIDSWRLRRVAFDDHFRLYRGLCGRGYIAQVHESKKVAKMVLEAYGRET